MSFASYVFGAAVAFGLGSLLTLSACGSPDIAVYKEQKPTLNIRDYLNGSLKAFGIIEDFTGKVVSRFTVTLVGSWQGNVGTLKEDFLFDDGKTEQRIWTITLDESGHMKGTAHDVVGEAIGSQSGNAFNMTYTLRRDINGRVMNFSMDDWMYLVDEKHLINKTRMKKFGITVATLSIGFYKE
jgi:hypothetical protein